MAEDYYYISGGTDDPWNNFSELQVGGVYRTGDINPYFNFFLQQLPSGVIVGDRRLSSLDYLNQIRSGTLTTDLSIQIMATIGQQIAMHFCKYTRELIWENIRQSEFSHLPSRQKCIWISQGQESLSYWESALGRPAGSYKVFRIEVDGLTHEASDEFLMRDEILYPDAMLMARDYWNGKITNEIKKEILFEGEFTIKEQLK